MVAERIGTSDIQSIGAYGTLEVTLPDYKACMSAKNLVTYTKNMYPRDDGLTYTCCIDRMKHTITISVVNPDNVNRKNK